MFAALKEHWPEYLMEAAGLGIFMVSACVFGALLEYPVSPVHQTIRDPIVRRILMGLARGLTAVGLIYSPWGKQSGAHFNPAITLTFCWLGKVKAWDACFYTVAQCNRTDSPDRPSTRATGVAVSASIPSSSKSSRSASETSRSSR
jgi:glycerol uptake facilitator-like aquaporin